MTADLSPRAVQAVANLIAIDRRLRRPTSYSRLARQYGFTERQVRRIAKGQIRPDAPCTPNPPVATGGFRTVPEPT